MLDSKKSLVYERVLNDILKKIENGELVVDERLPSERDLANEFKVSRGSLREALRILEELGYIQSTPSGGRILIRNTTIEAERDMVYKQLERAKIYDFLEVREWLDDVIVTLACERATPDDIKKIEEVYLKLAECYRSNSVVNTDALGLQFHMSIAEVTHNSVFEVIYYMSYDYTPALRESTLKEHKNRTKMIEEHGQIVDAIKKRDALAARLASRIHNRSIRQRYSAI
jgi:DNA-binding FadR family transcriptional regulator